MAKNWIWVGKYLFVILLAIVLGAAIGNLALFKTATLGTPKLTAGVLARFIAHTTALGLLWFLGLRASQQLREGSGGMTSLAVPILSLVALIVVPSFYVVLLQFINPFLSRDLKPFIDWAFIVGTLAAATWLVWAFFTNMDAVLEAIRRAAVSKKKPEH